ncbi:hypothetical protein RHSIM_Rhsim05G0214300 [Rhododendron simsii]|uniref:Alkyl transferase n=1 Tax=Rhododendron simsii TaxID=118357 RepID=A0A834LPC0_RHOSS|nr:hypothetical protein RHSIM_Rhsim05G0214300 [Rhododendron simsii]
MHPLLSFLQPPYQNPSTSLLYSTMLSLTYFPLSPPLTTTPTLSPLPPLLLRLHHRTVSRLLCSTAQNVAIDDFVGGRVEEDDVVSLPAGLRREAMPEHLAVIMDGNRRWARTKGLPVVAGYEAGLRALKGMVQLCCRWGIRVLTIFAFSSDNWLRPKVEVGFLMRLLERGMKDEVNNFMRDNIRFSCIGDTLKLPDPVKELITYAEERTKHNSGLQLIVAVSYSGKYDIVQACQSIALKVKDGVIEPEDINEFLIEQELQTNCAEIPNPDLLIRTSGELRVSNFLLWQLAYTELYFTQSHWPDFGETEFVMALRSFQQRQRRYGKRDS